MKRRVIASVLFGIVMAIIWSVCFVNVLHSMAGIGVGIAFGVSFSMLGLIIFRSLDKKDKE